MNQNRKIYVPPKAKIYRFDRNDQVLTASSGTLPPTADPTAEYAARALNEAMSGTNTTIE